MLIFLGLLYGTPYVSDAQRITYSRPEQDDDYRNTEFEIIGKVGEHIEVFKNNRDHYAISVYNQDMELEKRVPLTFLPRKLINVDFIPYDDHFQMIYQFQRNNLVYCYGVSLNEDATFTDPPVLIDSSEVGSYEVKTKIYSVQHSDDKSQVMIYKINRDKKYNNIFYTFLLDARLQLQNNSQVVIPLENKRNFLSNFLLTNDGNFAFVKLSPAGSGDNISEAQLVVKAPTVDSFEVHDLDLKGKYLDEIKLKADNVNKKIFLASFYYLQRRGNVEGLYAGEYNWDQHQFEGLKFITFSDELKMNARVQVSQNSAFNNYFIRNLVVRNDGGFLLTAESYYSSSRYQPWDRWGYLSSPWGYSAYSYPYYYSPYSPWYYSPYYWDNNRGTTYHYDYVAILSYDGSGKLQWSNFIPKEQTADDNASFLSYKMVNIGNELLFTYNELFRRSYLLTAVSVTPDGKLGKLPTLRSLDRGYAWMPRFGVQVSARQVVIPCIYRNYICFAKIDF